MKKMIVILIAGVVVGITISGLYKHFVTDRIMDGGDMENKLANVFQDADTLKSIHWTQSGSSYNHGWCIDTEGSGEKVERTDAPLTAEQWAEVEQCLRDNWHQPPKVLPEGLSVLDGMESYLSIPSVREGETLTAEYNGEYEHALEGLLRELLMGASAEYAPPEA